MSYTSCELVHDDDTHITMISYGLLIVLFGHAIVKCSTLFISHRLNVEYCPMMRCGDIFCRTTGPSTVLCRTQSSCCWSRLSAPSAPSSRSTCPKSCPRCSRSSCTITALAAASLPRSVQSRLAITRLAITRFGYNAVGRGPRISAARGEMGATANNNAVINCHLCLRNPHVCLVQVYLETI